MSYKTFHLNQADAMDRLVTDANMRNELEAPDEKHPTLTRKDIANQIHLQSGKKISFHTIMDLAKKNRVVHIPPHRSIVEAVAKRLISIKYPEPVGVDYIVAYLEAADYNHPYGFLCKEKVPGCYVKECPTVPCLVGRDQTLEESATHLSDQCVLLLWGLSGNGKTALAIQCADKYKNKMDAILWETADDSLQPLTLTRLLDSMSDKLHMGQFKQIADETSKISEICKFISNNNLKILLVVDNFNAVPEENAKDIVRFISDHFSGLDKCKTIITTQARPNDLIKRCYDIHVVGLEKRHGVALMRVNLGGLKISDDSLAGIVKACDGNPQILLTAVQLLKRSVMHEEILESLVDCEDNWFTEFYRLVWRHLTTDVKTVVMATSLFPKSVSVEALEKVTGLSSKKFRVARSRACDYSLIERYKFEERRFGQHELVRCVAKRDFDLPENAEIVSKLHQNWGQWTLKFSSQFERDAVWNHHSRLQALENNEFSDLVAVQATLQWFRDQGKLREFLALSRNLRYFYYTRGFWEPERSLDRQCVEVAEQLGDEVAKLDALLYLLNVASKQGNHAEIQDNLVEMDRLWKRRDIIKLPELKRVEYRHVLALIAQLQKYSGWEEKCLDLWQENLEWLESHSDEASGNSQEWNSFSFHYNVNLRYLANHHFEMGNWEEARKYFDRALRDSQEKCFERGRLWVTIKLAALDIRQEQPQIALNALNEIASSVDALKDVLTLAQLNMLRGDALVALCNPREARLFYREAREAFRLLEQMQCLECVENKIKNALEVENSFDA